LKLKDIYDEINIGRIGQINEAGLSRLLQMAQERDFCIATAFRHENSLSKNRANNKQINSMLAGDRMSGYALIGHWQEGPEGANYHEVKPEDLTDSIEESILFTRPESMPILDFIKFSKSIGIRFHQDAVILGIGGNNIKPAYYKNKLDPKNRNTVDVATGTTDESGITPGVYLVFQDGSVDKIGTSISLGKIAQAYSQMRNKPNIPFIFEGVLQPTNNISKQAFTIRNIKYLV